MATDIDSLQIQINATATKANDALDKLVSKLDKLTASLSGIDGSKLNGLASGVSQLGAAMQTMNNVKTTDFTRLAKNISNLNNLDTSKLSSVSANISKIGASVSGLSGVSQGVSQITELADGIKQLGYKSADKAIDNIPKLAASMKQLMKELSAAPKVSQNLIDMTNALARLARTGASSGKAAQSLSTAFDGISKSSISALGGIKKINIGLGGILKRLAPLVGAVQLFNFGKESIEIASNLTEVQNVVDTTFGNFKQKIEDLSSTSIMDLGMSEYTAKQIGSTFQAMGGAMGFAQGEMADMSVELVKLTGDMASFYDVAQEDVGKSLQSIFTGETEPLRKYGLDLTQATLQQWALNNGINASVSSMSQLEKAQLRYQYVMANTGAAQGDFAKTMDSWSNQVRILKQQLQQLASVIGGTLINALKPLVKALNSAMSHIIAFAKTISNALGKIFGWTYEEGAASGVASDFDSAESAAGGIADSTGTAAKNIDKMKKGIRAFDELKTIELNDDSSSGGGTSGGGSSGGGATAAGGQWTQAESILKSFESEIDSLYELGAYIGKALTDAMNSIDWDSIYEKARGFGTGLAEFLNGLISPELFGAVGRTIASALNTAIYAALSFGETFDWEDFGLSIAEGINEFFATFDFASLSETLNAWAIGILDSAIVALENIKWDEIGLKIGEFLKGINFLEIGKRIVILIWDAIKAAWDLTTGSFSVAPIETALIGILTLPAIVEFGSKLIGFIVDPFKNAWAIIEPILSTAVSMINPITLAIAALTVGLGIAYTKNEEVRESFANATQAIKEGFQPAVEFITNTLLPNLQAGWERLKEILEPLTDFLNDTFVSIWQDMINPVLTYIGETVLPLVTGAFENLWNNVLVPLGDFLADVLEPTIQKVCDVLSILWENIVIPLADAIGNILGKAFEGLVEIFNKTVVPITNKVIKVFQFLWNNVLSPIVDFLWDSFKPNFENVFNVIKNLIGDLKTIFSGLIDFITGVFTGNWEKAWDGIKDIFRGIFNGIVSIAEGVINNIINGINVFLRGFNGIVTSVGDVIGIDISIPEISNVELPRFETGGFPKQYSLFMAGENGIPEIAGTVGGKTAVAGGAEITGISDTIRATSNEEMALLRQQNMLLQALLEKEVGISKNDIGKAAQSWARDYSRRTGREAYSF